MRTYTLEVTKFGQPPIIREVDALNLTDAICQVRQGRLIPSPTKVEVRGWRDVGTGAPVAAPKRCVAKRTARAHDPKIILFYNGDGRPNHRYGRKRCGKCGNEVELMQAVDGKSGAPKQAWQYLPHNV